MESTCPNVNASDFVYWSVQLPGVAHSAIVHMCLSRFVRCPLIQAIDVMIEEPNVPTVPSPVTV